MKKKRKQVRFCFCSPMHSIHLVLTHSAVSSKVSVCISENISSIICACAESEEVLHLRAKYEQN